MPERIHPSYIFPFPLDPFQLESIEALNQGHSLVVSAPTGSGKTLVAEYAIYRALSHHQRVFYTTPLKALSNQKLRDFRKQFGVERVGLLTGDITLNRNAEILVMTTEIFRNMFYGVSNIQEDPLKKVEAVILDECHYMNDAQRGTVWEESIIHCPLNIQIVALSATIANAGQLADWIDRVHGPTTLVMSDYRPVALRFNFCSIKGLHPLAVTQTRKADYQLQTFKKGKKTQDILKRNKINTLHVEIPPIQFVLLQMAERQMLPAIYFIFSRRNCDKAVTELHEITLVTQAEQIRINHHLNLYKVNHPTAIREACHIDALRRGIAAHHAGILPPWKELIEQLFQEGLIKVVFATETLAAGINMPARSTIISSLSKRTETGHRPLQSNEFLQMAGRAGRRGLDKQGYVVIVQSHLEGIVEATQLINSKSDPLTSQFVPTYGMVISLMEHNNLNQAKEIIERSFGQYLVSLNFANRQATIKRLRSQLSSLNQQSIPLTIKESQVNEKLNSCLREERYILSLLHQEWNEKSNPILTSVLRLLKEGVLINVRITSQNNAILPAVLVRKINRPSQSPLILCLTCENIWVLLSCNSIVRLHTDIDYLKLNNINSPSINHPGPLIIGDNGSMRLALAIAHIVNYSKIIIQISKADASLRSQLKLGIVEKRDFKKESAAIQEYRRNIKRHKREILKLAAEINHQEVELKDQTRSYWDMFLSTVEILQHFGCIHQLKPTSIGRTISLIRGDNELWLGLILVSGHLDDLQPSELVAVAESITVEINRPDISCTYMVSLPVNKAFHAINEIRCELLQAQQHARVSIPIWWEPELMGLAQAWSNGVAWNNLIQNTSIDEGDIVKIMRRTIDFLSQIPNCPTVSERLRSNASMALNTINRFPVSDSELWLDRKE
ncbi:putative DNA helicase (chromatophore) [Paulinella micropora]|uniref:DEAD/DEAH box helicase n=1 Tax=Paulinella micropora TaxID=1928728 RepID=A0A1S6YHG7_9EUKA|nr:DEAD/DEAH box helicase [Paulinella micropora]BBL85956.1 putative DNA helicase [Paulinella micropora]